MWIIKIHLSQILIDIFPLLDQLQPLLQQQPLREGDLNQEEIGSIVLHVVVFLPQMPQIVVLSMLVIHHKEKLVILVMFVCGIPIWNQQLQDQQLGNVIPQESFWEVLIIPWNHKLSVIQEGLRKGMILLLHVFVLMTIVMVLILEDKMRLQEGNHQGQNLQGKDD